MDAPPTEVSGDRPADEPQAGAAPPAIADPVPETDAAVVIEGATKRFGDDIAVDRISLIVLKGTILGIIGPSGSGKTTTIRLLTGALAPTEGHMRVLGEDPRAFLRQTRERIGYMPQQFTLYPDLTARENVDFIASLFGMPWWTRHRRTREVLQLVDLWDVRGRRAGRLSGGMQRRLELASALVHDPDLMFLDEPTAGIDPILRVKVWDELHRLRDGGRTLLVTTQYVSEAESCDVVALISGGRLIALARPLELRREALGGDIVEITTTDAFDGSRLTELPIVRSIERRGPNELRVRVDDASTAMADVVDAITAQGGHVASVSEARPTFDEVFAILVERDRVARGEERGEAA
jgi:ABC-2 type transport system ATP-binding protein